ncbi:hypothetical protein Salat_2972300 [Sesamum alatum]|uniref:Uncharacterized protein n=1 Tax=Sesamum alatum TaxID=300844 RepID=A0AAE1XHY9_9LAMI|nr:hypothetical protein Salat_2972300 [Sesamum alatum]
MNRGEPSDDLPKIKGEILSSGDLFTLPRTDTCTECSYGKVDSSVWLLQEILSFLSTQGGADTPAGITGDSYKNGGEVNSTRRHSGMDVDPSGRDNHSSPRRWRPFSRTKKTELRKPYESLKRRQEGS